MPKDGLVRLPDHIVAGLLRALASICHTPQSRLHLLPPAGGGRAPVWDTPNADFDVMWRGRRVGRIWRFVYEREECEACPWHWDISAPDRKHEWGHALTLHEAMEQFRTTWDRLEPGMPVGDVEAS